MYILISYELFHFSSEDAAGLPSYMIYRSNIWKMKVQILFETFNFSPNMLTCLKAIMYSLRQLGYLIEGSNIEYGKIDFEKVIIELLTSTRL